MNQTSKKKLTAVIAASLAGVVGVGAILNSAMDAKAMGNTRMSGISTILSSTKEDAPFTIVEVVPDHAYDSVGYLVSGCMPESIYAGLERVTPEDAAKTPYETRQALIEERVGTLLGVNNAAGVVALKGTTIYEEKLILNPAEDVIGTEEGNWRELVFADGYKEDRKGHYTLVNSGGEYTIMGEDTSSGGVVSPTDFGVEVQSDAVQQNIQDETATNEESGEEQSSLTLNEDKNQRMQSSLVVTSTDAAASETSDDPKSDSSKEGTAEVSETVAPEPKALAEDGEQTDDDLVPATIEKINAENSSNYEITYTPGAGNYNWVDDSTEAALSVELGSVYVRVNITNKDTDLFNNSIFEKAIGSTTTYVNVISVTPAELETKMTTGEISLDKVGMLWISDSTSFSLVEGTPEYSFHAAAAEEVRNDLDWQTVLTIYDYVVENSLPVVLDYKIFDNAMAADSNAGNLLDNSNMFRLAVMLSNQDLETEKTTYFTSEAEIKDTIWNTELTQTGTSTKIKFKDKLYREMIPEITAVLTMDAAVDHELVNGSIYITSRALAFMESSEDGKTKNVFLNKTYDSVALKEENNLYDVVNGFTDEKFYLDIENQSLDTEAGSAAKKLALTEYVTVDNKEQLILTSASAIKYILNCRYSSQTIKKDSLRVLVIEPVMTASGYSDFTEAKLRNWIGDNNDVIKSIKMDIMTSSEYIGKITDLKTAYDLIYIGTYIGAKANDTTAVAGSLNLKKSGVTIQTNDEGYFEADYNDNSMDGLIYTHVGDVVGAHEGESRMGQLLQQDSLSTKFVTRYSGNDITYDNYVSLKGFADAGYPVIFEKQFYSIASGTKTVRVDRIDKSSYMYQFADAIKRYGNAISTDQLAANSSSVLSKYINLAKLSINLLDKPIEYAENANNYLSAVEGKYYLKYLFEISNNGVYSGSGNYTAGVYVDLNADGKFSKSEELDGVQVTDASTGAVVTNGQLKAGVRYQVSRVVPDNYSGILPWELKINETMEKETDEPKLVTSVTGYTSMPAPSGSAPIHILQINSDKSYKTSGGGVSTGTESSVNLEFLTETKKTSYFYKYLKNDNIKKFFNVDIDTITVTQYKDNYNNLSNISRNEYNALQSTVESYDMLILGFSDVYDKDGKLTTDSLNKVKAFINSGKPVLFAHDTTSFFNKNDTWGYKFNSTVRALVGMDRYGVSDVDDFVTTSDTLQSQLYKGKNLTKSGDETLWNAIEDFRKDYAYTPINDPTQKERESTSAYTQGYTNNLLAQYGKSGSITDSTNSKTYQINNAYLSGVSLGGSNRVVNLATKVNDGQITNYPYKLNDTINISSTHNQYYQLDMNKDMDNDDTSDIVVWYCLAGSDYSLSPNDVRNNYYIYNVGNVTYTGMGHSGGSIESSNYTDEVKLFVNTMVAAYSAGTNPPSVDFVDNGSSTFNTADYTYVTYDGDVSLDADETLDLYYHVTDNTVTSGTKTISYQYFYETDDTSVEVTTVNGESVRLAPLGGEYIDTYKMTNAGEKDGDALESDDSLSSGKVYGAEFNVKNLLVADQGLSKTFSDTSRIRIFVQVHTMITYLDGSNSDVVGGATYGKNSYAQISILKRKLFNLN